MLKLAAYVQTLLGRYNREEGQTMAEYAVILTVISSLVLLALVLLGTNITGVIVHVVELAGGRVTVVEAPPENIKVTRPADLELVAAALRARHPAS